MNSKVRDIDAAPEGALRVGTSVYRKLPQLTDSVWFCLTCAIVCTLSVCACVHRQWKRRFDVYVCTAAERGYALEAWRLLDSNNDIIPDSIRDVRVVCVPGGQKKELRRVFRIQAPIMYRSGRG